MDQPLLLVVEDEPINREILVDTLRENGYATITAVTGNEAWQAITAQRDRLDAILLDRLLPDMDALGLLLRLKAEPDMTHLPVIMQTSMSAESDIADGLKAGAFYYLTKPFPPATLLAIVRSAVQDRRAYLDLQRSLQSSRSILSHMSRAEFWFKTLSEARDLATLVAHVAPDPQRVVLGLTELMLNAVEHGNLEISYADKSDLILTDTLDQEVERRLALPNFSQRRARVTVTQDPGGVHFCVADEGKGFNWQDYIEMSPARAFDTHGRGIAMSRLLSFDRVEYRGCGNEVIGSVFL